MLGGSETGGSETAVSSDAPSSRVSTRNFDAEAVIPCLQCREEPGQVSLCVSPLTLTGMVQIQISIGAVDVPT